MTNSARIWLSMYGPEKVKVDDTGVLMCSCVKFKCAMLLFYVIILSVLCWYFLVIN